MAQPHEQARFAPLTFNDPVARGRRLKISGKNTGAQFAKVVAPVLAKAQKAGFLVTAGPSKGYGWPAYLIKVQSPKPSKPSFGSAKVNAAPGHSFGGKAPGKFSDAVAEMKRGHGIDFKRSPSGNAIMGAAAAHERLIARGFSQAQVDRADNMARRSFGTKAMQSGPRGGRFYTTMNGTKIYVK
jgi:hypothetical protein